jgi:hypothetical protein
VNWDKYRTQLEALPEARRDQARQLAERLEREGWEPDAAVLEAMRRFAHDVPDDVPHHPDALTSPDISIEHPHGPEGASHGGRGGRDPLRFVEDATPTGTNAYSRTRGSPRATGRRRTAKGRRRTRSG